MNPGRQGRRRSDLALAGEGLVVALCCAVGPAGIAAAGSSIIGWWLGVASAAVVATGGGLVVLRRRGRNRGRRR